LEPDLGLFSVCFCIEESTPLLRLLGAPSQNLRNGVVLGPIVGAFGEMSSHVDFLADVIADALTAQTSPTTVTGARRSSRPITAGCFIARGGSPPIVGGHAYARSPEPRTSPERPTGPKPTSPCSQRLWRSDRLRKLYEPRARLPVRPGGLCRHRLDGILSASY